MFSIEGDDDDVNRHGRGDETPPSDETSVLPLVLSGGSGRLVIANGAAGIESRVVKAGETFVSSAANRPGGHFRPQDFGDFFQTAVGKTPFPFQREFAQASSLPQLVQIPTGLGKTAMAVVGWLWRRFNGDEPSRAVTPRRLVYCLPMRVLVEQTVDTARAWIDNLAAAGFLHDGGPPVHVLMGGESADDWDINPEREAILVGTQDMLLSRALMRGYGMSRYQWPVHFALLHNDALWIYDEVQLMGPALSTSAQLEGFRRSEALRPMMAAGSVWLSATLNPEWLDTVDLRPHRDHLISLQLSDDEKRHPVVRARREAVKVLRRAETKLSAEQATKRGLQEYAENLAQEVLAEHDSEGDTLIVVNRVDRAQALFDALRKQTTAADVDQILLIHARFRPAERREIELRLCANDGAGRVIVATQAIEAGVDMTSRVLFTELAPWSSLVQRFGRCNRYGESNQARVFWIDAEADDRLAPPYEPDALTSARERLKSQTSAGSADLPPTDETRSVGQVLRRRDLLDLFNNEPDLSGFDIDISPYIRDTGSPQVEVFWRAFGDKPGDQPRPLREELCPVSLSQLRDHLGKERSAYTWDALSDLWRPTPFYQIIPGATVLLRAADGGYDAARGFTAGGRSPVEPIGQPQESEVPHDSDAESFIGRFVSLTEHLDGVADETNRLVHALAMQEDAASVVTAGLWHDVGKAHPAFQTPLKDGHEPPLNHGTLWAKSPGSGRLDYRVTEESGEIVRRPRFRHELASMLAWLDHGHAGKDHDLIAFLIAAHHGKIRMGLRALPEEKEPPDGRRFARGVWEGDLLPPVGLNGITVPGTRLRLDVMELGRGGQGPSWTERTQRLLEDYGPFRLAWLEALVRIADRRTSRHEQEQPT